MKTYYEERPEMTILIRPEDMKEAAEKKAALESELRRIIAQGEVISSGAFVLPQGWRYDMEAEIAGTSGSVAILLPDGSVSGVVRSWPDSPSELQTTHDPRAAEILRGLIAGL